jgi:hypothetical protein
MAATLRRSISARYTQQYPRPPAARPRHTTHRRIHRDARTQRCGRWRWARWCEKARRGRTSWWRKVDTVPLDFETRWDGMSVSRPHSPVTICRLSANVPQRAGASRWGVAMSASLRMRYPFESASLTGPGGGNLDALYGHSTAEYINVPRSQPRGTYDA